MPAHTSQTDGDSAVRAEVFLKCPPFDHFLASVEAFGYRPGAAIS